MIPFLKVLKDEEALINAINHLKKVLTELDLNVNERGMLLTMLDDKQRELHKTQLEIKERIEYYVNLK